MKTFYEKNQNQFAAYFNMARQNLYMVMQRISQIIGVDTAAIKENHLSDIIKKWQNLKSDKKEFVSRQLYKHLPFLKCMTDVERIRQKKKAVDVDMLFSVLQNVVVVLTLERDKASHPTFVDERLNDSNYIKSESLVVRCLNHCFTVAVRMIKGRFSLTSSDLEFITKKRYAQRKINPEFEYSIVDEKRHLSDIGRIFLICQFIEKQYATMFFDAMQEQKGPSKVSAFYGNHPEKERKIIREIFSAYRLRPYKERLDGEMESTALALDMLNELKKCPSELFDHLSPRDQEVFRVSSSDDESETEILQKRYSDRFAYLSLRFIDEQKLFDKIRFQVNFGKYRTCLAESKKCVDNLERIRVVQKDLNAFRRYGELEAERLKMLDTGNWHGVKVESTTEVTHEKNSDFPYITNSKTRYVFNGDRIGLGLWVQDGDFNSFGNYMPKIADGKVSCVQPVCWLSVYEIPALLFHLYLCNKNKKKGETEKLIKDQVSLYKKLFKELETIEKIKCRNVKSPRPEEYKEFEEKYGIKWKDVPEKIRDYLTGRSRSGFRLYAEALVKKEIEATETRIERFENNIKKVSSVDNKMGKRMYVDIKPGALATFLMRDILSFQSSAKDGDARGSDKLTGLNYRVLQSNIAQYNLDKIDYRDFRQMFVKAGLVESDHSHPFLKEVLDCKPCDVLDFYKIYLEKKLSYLKSVQREKTYSEEFFLHPDRLRWGKHDKDYFQGLAKRYMEQPIELPRGLFKDDITAMLQKEDFPDDVKAKLADSNVAYMILLYHKYIANDDLQDFYAFPRNYRIVDLLESGKGRMKSRKEKAYLTLEEYEKRDLKKEKDSLVSSLQKEETYNKGKIRFREATVEEKMQEDKHLTKCLKEYDDNERSLRRYKVQDILLFYMAKKALGDSVEEFKLEEISPSSEKSILDVPVPFWITLNVKSADGTVRPVKIKQDSLKIKKYKDFYRFIYDDRVKSLLPLVDDLKVEIDKSDLEEELSRYDRLRPAVFDTLLGFERYIESIFPELKTGRHGFSDSLAKADALDETERKEIRLIRNAFSHNQYPDIEVVKNGKMPEIAEKTNMRLKEQVEKSRQKQGK